MMTKIRIKFRCGDVFDIDADLDEIESAINNNKNLVLREGEEIMLIVPFEAIDWIKPKERLENDNEN